MLDVVTLLESAGAGTAFEAVDADLADAVQAWLAEPVGLPTIVACMVMTPDDGESEPAQDEPDRDGDGDRDDGQGRDAPDARSA